MRLLLPILCIEALLRASIPTPLPIRPQIPLGSTWSGGTGWIHVQHAFWDKNSNGTGGGTCSVSGTTCVVNVSAVGSGHILNITLISNNNAVTLSSISEETTLDCAPCLNTSVITLDTRYTLSATGGETTITANVSAAPGVYFGISVDEWIKPAGSTVSLDTGGFINTTSCSTSCSGVGLTLCGTGTCTGTPDVIVQVLMPDTDFVSAVSSPYTATCSGNPGCTGNGTAYLANTGSGTAPTWTLNSTQNVQGTAIAFTTATVAGLTLISHTLAHSSTQQTTVSTSAINCSGANLIVAAVAYSVTTTQTLTDNSSNTYSTAITNNLGSIALNIYYLFGTSVGTSSMTWTITAGVSGDYDSLAVACFSGAVSAPLDQTNSAVCCSASGGYQPGSVTTSQTELLISAIGDGSNATNDTINSSYTITDQVLQADATNSGLSMAYFIQSSSGSSNPTWTVGAQTAAFADGSVSIATFK